MNEIKRQLKLKIGDTTDQQKNVMNKLYKQYPFRSKQKIKILAPIAASIAVLITTIILVFSFNSEEINLIPNNLANPSDTVIMNNYSNGETVELPLYMYNSFLNYVLDNKYGEEEDILSTLQYIDVNTKDTLSNSYIVSFDCGKRSCASAYMSVGEKDGVMAPLGEGTITSNLIYSPDSENMMFLLSIGDSTKQRIVVINFKSNGESRIPSAYHEYFSYYNWPITNIEWITNKKISVTVADIESNTDELIKQWLQKSDKPSKTFEVTLPYK